MDIAVEIEKFYELIYKEKEKLQSRKDKIC